jgi:hypothetical protein
MGAMRRSGQAMLATLLAALALGLGEQLAVAAGDGEVDTQFIFGFTQGADVGEVGEREIEHQTIGHLGKRDGSYAALTDNSVTNCRLSRIFVSSLALL